MIEVSKDDFYKSIGLVKGTRHGSTSHAIDGVWVDSWEIKFSSGKVLGRTVGAGDKTVYFVASGFVKKAR